MKNKNGAEFKFHPIITPKENVNKKNARVKNIHVFATNHLWCNEDEALKIIPDKYKER